MRLSLTVLPFRVVFSAVTSRSVVLSSSMSTPLPSVSRPLVVS